MVPDTANSIGNPPKMQGQDSQIRRKNMATNKNIYDGTGWHRRIGRQGAGSTVAPCHFINLMPLHMTVKDSHWHLSAMHDAAARLSAILSEESAVC